MRTRETVSLTIAFGSVVVATLLSCLPAVSPAQQEQDAAALLACAQRDWGKPVEVMAHDCTQDAVDVAIDVVADVVVLFGTASTDAGADAGANSYASEPRVQARVMLKRGATAPISADAASQ